MRSYFSSWRLHWQALTQWLCLALLCSSLGLAHAQLQLKIGEAAAPGISDTVTTPRVQAQLVLQAPQGIAAGMPLQLGLRMRHQPQWHTYWKNAGDSGLPTQLQWQLPAGINAGEIAWPLPEQIRVGDLLNYGYEGEVLLPLQAQVNEDFNPDAEGMVDIGLHASWLVCRVECIPEEGQFHLRVPAEVAQTMWQADFDAAQAKVPQAWLAQGQALASPDSERLQLRVQGLPEHLKGEVLDFFPEDEATFQHAAVLGQDWQQAWEGDVWTADLPLSNMRGETPPFVNMVLAKAVAPETHKQVTEAWRIRVPVQGQWQAAHLTQVSPALETALAANAAKPISTVVTTADRGLSGWAVAVLGGLLGGVLLNLMPCVFPVLAIKLLAVARHGGDIRSQRAHGLAYAAGVVLSFAALGAVLLGLRAAGEQLGWGFQLQSPLVVAGLAALFTLIGLNLAGVFEIRQVVPTRLANLHARHPLADAFISGVVAVAIASPCTAPFMGASLGFAVGMPAMQALTVFVALGVGMALPYVLVTWVPALIRWLPRPGQWMETFRHAMAFPMFATVVWLVWVLGQQSGIDGTAALLALLLCLAALMWALTLRGISRLAWSGAILMLAVWLGNSIGRNIVQEAPATTASADSHALWQPWSAQAQADLLAQGRAVFVDYTAAWCVTCQYNKRSTLSNPEVLADFSRRNVALLRADWTRQDAAITAELTRLGRNGVPTYVLLSPQAAPVVMTELLSVDEVRTALAALPVQP